MERFLWLCLSLFSFSSLTAQPPLIPPESLIGVAMVAEDVSALLAARPVPVRRLLSILMQHLARVAAKAEVNKMTAHNLGLLAIPISLLKCSFLRPFCPVYYPTAFHCDLVYFVGNSTHTDGPALVFAPTLCARADMSKMDIAQRLMTLLITQPCVAHCSD